MKTTKPLVEIPPLENLIGLKDLTPEQADLIKAAYARWEAGPNGDARFDQGHDDSTTDWHGRSALLECGCIGAVLAAISNPNRLSFHDCAHIDKGAKLFAEALGVDFDTFLLEHLAKKSDELTALIESL